MLIKELIEKGAKVQVHDPEAMENVRADFGDKLTYCELPQDAVRKADALVIMTEWKNYHRPNWDEVLSAMASPTVFDGRNLYDPERMKQRGVKYYSIGRPTV